jgi:hypothetical protein
VDVALEKLSATFTPARKLLGDYIPREEAEADLHNYVGADGATAAAGTNKSGYIVVTAPKGCGRLTVIHHVLAEVGRTGVVLIS